MQILKLSIQGFKSFTKEQILDFNKIPEGLIFISGENEVSPRLGGNGVGKSALFEALSFVFYGKTSTKDKAGDLKNWQSKDKLKVSVEFNQNDTFYTLERTWNPNTLLLNGETVTQERLEEIVGMNFPAFVYAVFISQHVEKFVDLPPVEKMDIFTTVLNLNKWDTFSDKAKDKKNILSKEIDELERKKISVEGEISGIDISTLEQSIKNFQFDLDKKLKEVEKVVKENDEQLLSTTSELPTVKGKIKELADAIVETNKNIIAFDVELSELSNKITGREYKSNDLLNQIRMYDTELEKITGTENSPVCSTCFQPINKDVLKSRKEELYTLMSSLERAYNKCNKEKNGYKKEYDILGNERDSEWNLLRSLETQKRDVDSRLKELEYLKTMLSKRKVELATRLNEVKESENPYIKIKEEKEEKLSILQANISKIDKQLEEKNKNLVIYDYWVKGFKETKLMLLSEAITEFEIETNNKLQELGMEEWSIKAGVDTETKSGSIKKGFTILVNSPVNDKLVPFTCWSGGEGQRLRLAITLGLTDFIKNKNSTFWDILIFDEPTQFLSEEGIADLISTLREKSKEENLKIFLVDHRNLNTFGEFSEEIKIIKNKNGSEICHTQ